jgi:hypothetical protein
VLTCSLQPMPTWNHEAGRHSMPWDCFDCHCQRILLNGHTCYNPDLWWLNGSSRASFQKDTMLLQNQQDEASIVISWLCHWCLHGWKCTQH